MISRQGNPRSVDEMSPERIANCAHFCVIQKDLWFLEDAQNAPESDKKRIAEVTRKLVIDLLDMTRDEAVRRLLNFDELEMARLRNRREMTKDMRIKFRIFVDDFLDRHMPLELSSSAQKNQ